MLVIVIVCNFHKSSSETAHPPDRVQSMYCSKCRGSPDPILSPKNSKQQNVLTLHGAALCPISQIGKELENPHEGSESVIYLHRKVDFWGLSTGRVIDFTFRRQPEF